MALARIDADGEGNIIIPEKDNRLDRNLANTSSDDRISDQGIN